jgi:DNA-binding SARP family transcriptional activator
MIELRTLGPLDLRTDDGRVLNAVLAQPRRLALLIYLAIARPHGFHRRDHVVTLFWGEQDEEHGRAALNRALYFLRRALDDGAIVSRGDEIIVDRARLWCDSANFTAAVEEGRFADALQLYRGDLLPAFFISDGSEFERWLELERAHLRERAAHAASVLSEQAEARGDVLLAVQYARRANEFVPHDERLLRRVLTLLDRAGDRSGAVHAYEQFAARITEEFDLTPSPETHALVDSIRQRVDAVAQVETGNGYSANGSQAVEAAVPFESPPVRRSRSKLAMGSLAAAVLALAVFFAARMLRTAPADSIRVLVATVDTSNADARLARLATQAHDLIVQGLAQTPATVVVRGPERVRPTADRAARTAGLVTSARRAGAAFIVMPIMHGDADTIRIHAQIIDVRRGEVEWATTRIAASFAKANIALEELQQRTKGAIAILHDPRWGSWFRNAGVPPTYAAYQEFAKGYELRVTGGEPGKALEYLQRAFDLDSTLTWARMEKALAYMNLIKPDSAHVIALELNRKRDALLPLQRHYLDWMMAFAAEKPLETHEAMIKAAALAPERFLYGVALTGNWLNRPHTVIDALERLAALPDFDGGTMGYWGFLTDGYHQLGQHEKELAVARNARKRRPERMSELCLEIRALSAMGRTGEVRARLNEIYSYPPDKRQSFGAILVEFAPELVAHGLNAEAREMYERALEWYRTRPPEDTVGWDYQWEIGQALYQAGYLAEAEQHFRLAEALDPANQDGVAYVGVVAALRGDSLTARQVMHKLDDMRSTSARPLETIVLNKARISAALGDHQNAMRLLIDAMGGQGQDLHANPDFVMLRSNPRFREFIRPKG